MRVRAIIIILIIILIIRSAQGEGVNRLTQLNILVRVWTIVRAQSRRKKKLKKN